VVGAFDPGHDRDPQLGPGGPATPVQDVLLQQGEEGLHGGVVAAAREQEFRPEIDELRGEMARFIHGHLAEAITDERWALWAARLTLTVAIDAILTWFDVGSPEPDQAARRIDHVVQAVITAVRETELRAGLDGLDRP
jgi:hypothetical protein